MTTAEAIPIIRSQLQRMNTLHGGVVFDEWALLGLDAKGQPSVLAYEGPRASVFASEVGKDTRILREAVATRTHEVGDFEFVQEAPGASLDAFLRVGPASYLVCNYTSGTMADIRAEPRWRQAQAAWFDLGEKFRADPLAD